MKSIALFAILICLSSFDLFAWSSLKDFEKNQSKYKALFFLSHNCPCSKSHIEHIDSLKKAFKEVSFFGVATDLFEESNEKEIQAHYQATNYNMPIIKDTAFHLVEKYRALKTPHVILLEKKQDQYEVIYTGGLTNKRHFDSKSVKFLQDNLAELHAGRSVKYRRGKSLGCYIRRL